MTEVCYSSSNVSAVDINSVCKVCRVGDLAQLQHWYADGRLPDLNQTDDSEQYPHESAIEHGHLDVLKWLVEISQHRATLLGGLFTCLDLTCNNSNVAKMAATDGNLELLQWLVNDSGQAVDVATSWAVQAACAGGHFEIVRWIVEDSGQSVDLAQSNEAALRLAASIGRLDILKWLCTQSGQQLDVTAENNYALRTAISGGYIEVVKWLLCEYGHLIDVSADSNAILRDAIRYQEDDILHWILNSSGQLARILDVSTVTLLRQFAPYLDPGNFQLAELCLEEAKADFLTETQPLTTQIEALQQQIKDLQDAVGCLQTQKTAARERTSHQLETILTTAMSSVACQKAAENGLIPDFQTLLLFLKKEPSIEKQKRL